MNVELHQNEEPEPLTLVIVEAGAWEEISDNIDEYSKSCVSEVFSHLGQPQKQLNILLTEAEKLRALNKEHRGKDVSTNVLSFPSGDEGHLGDIAIACSVVDAEAHVQGKQPIAHFTHLLVHGVLHLLGHDHETDEEAALMEQIEVDILARYDIPNPYE